MSKRAPDHAAQIADHLRAFKLTTMADELVPRLVTACCENALRLLAVGSHSQAEPHQPL